MSEMQIICKLYLQMICINVLLTVSGINEDESMSQKVYEDMLREVGVKPTKVRVAIMSFISLNHGPHTVEELHENSSVTCDLVTVYRAIGLFEKHNLIQSCDFRDGQLRYEYNPEGVDHHHHVICRTCHAHEVVPLCVPGKWRKILGKLGYSNVSHQLEFFGLCRVCTDSG